LYWITAIVVSLSILTPGQVGEALKIELLKRRGVLDRLPGLGAFAVERILDLIVVAGMAVLGLFFGSGLTRRYSGLGQGAIGLMVLGVLAIIFLVRFDPGGRASGWLAGLREGSGSAASWLRMAALTVCSWGLVSGCWLIVLAAVQIRLSILETMWLTSVVTLGVILSFIPGGLGVSEVLAATLLSDMGAGAPAAQAGALMLRAYAVFVVFFGLVHVALWSIFRLGSRIHSYGSAN
jgi:glycosyltransferase 2 family protein